MCPIYDISLAERRTFSILDSIYGFLYLKVLGLHRSIKKSFVREKVSFFLANCDGKVLTQEGKVPG
jgi:hypothetical protein